MGLPIWRDPEEGRATRDALKSDPTAAARSSIRRRPSIHGRRSTRPRLTRDATVHLPRVDRSPPPTHRSALASDTRRDATHSGVPPVSTLLESADRHRSIPPPPPVPESRNYYDHGSSSNARGGVSGTIARLQQTAARLERQTEVMRNRLQSNIDSERQSGQTAPSARRPLRNRRELPPPPQLPEGMRRALRERAHRDAPTGRVTLPTPPLDTAETDGDSLFVPETRPRTDRGTHPLSNSWSPASPVDGLGDRNRSPTPADGWEVIRTTITPDATLPSVDSSFTSAAASQSFSSGQDTATTEPEAASSSSNSQHNSSSDDSQSDSISSVDPDDLVCEDDQGAGAEAMAEYMFDYDMTTTEGRRRIRDMNQIRERDGNRFALAHEAASVDIGFRLIENALETEEGRDRLIEVGVLAQSDDAVDLENAAEAQRQRRARWARVTHQQSRRSQIIDGPTPIPRPEQYGEDTRSAVNEASARVHDYFRRYTADSLQSRARSPPPQYGPLASHPDVETFTSRDEPEAQSVSPPTQRSQAEVADALMSGDETDLAAMRRVVERLARRDDVPEEWWSSIGLNLSRTRPRVSSPRRSEMAGETAAGDRVRGGRIERRNSRL